MSTQDTPEWWAYEGGPQRDDDIQDLLISLRWMLRTALQDTPETIQRPTRRLALEATIKRITFVLEKINSSDIDW